MKILLIHNHYQQAGGEDSVFQAEKELLEHAGHQVIVYERDNAEINSYAALQKLSLIKNTTWSGDSQREISQILKRERPQVAHFHNTFPLISPSGYFACREAGVPVIQTIHNYRLLCSNALLYRNEHICEACLGKTPPWPGLLYGCYQGSRGKTLILVSMLTIHRLIRTWEKMVDVFIALSVFSRVKLIEGGLPAEKIIIKPNFVFPDPGQADVGGSYGIVVGRLSQEKGIDALLKAWDRLTNRRLKVVGDGPLMQTMQEYINSHDNDNVELCGWMPRDKTMASIKGSMFLIFPSQSYENFPLVIAEAYACGKPVIAPRLGAMQEIVWDGITGVQYTPGNIEDLAEKIEWAFTHPGAVEKMGQNAREEYEQNYSADTNYQKLIDIYDNAINRR